MIRMCLESLRRRPCWPGLRRKIRFTIAACSIRLLQQTAVAVGIAEGDGRVAAMLGIRSADPDRGRIYPILGRLTRRGRLEANWVEGEAPHPRKYYRLTWGRNVSTR